MSRKLPKMGYVCFEKASYFHTITFFQMIVKNGDDRGNL